MTYSLAAVEDEVTPTAPPVEVAAAPSIKKDYRWWLIKATDHLTMAKSAEENKQVVQAGLEYRNSALAFGNAAAGLNDALWKRTLLISGLGVGAVALAGFVGYLFGKTRK